MNTVYRYDLVGGDLVMECGVGIGPFRVWDYHRNLDEEARIAWENAAKLEAKAEEARQIAVIASTNVRMDREMLQMNLMHDSDYVMVVDTEKSIVETRDGVKYNLRKGNSGNKGGNGGGNGGNNQNQGQSQNNQSNRNNGNNGDQQQQAKKQKGGNRRPVSLLELLASAQISFPSQTTH